MNLLPPNREPQNKYLDITDIFEILESIGRGSSGDVKKIICKKKLYANTIYVNKTLRNLFSLE